MRGFRSEIRDTMRFCMTIQEAYADALLAENEIWHSQEEKFLQRSGAHIV